MDSDISIYTVNDHSIIAYDDNNGYELKLYKVPNSKNWKLSLLNCNGDFIFDRTCNSHIRNNLISIIKQCISKYNKNHNPIVLTRWYPDSFFPFLNVNEKSPYVLTKIHKSKGKDIVVIKVFLSYAVSEFSIELYHIEKLLK